ncbi:MAG: hypothetical protein JXB50_15365 [Spirochaetes bacterium]|nr:hypothetical protein [Spirochaetota bacterium]
MKKIILTAILLTIINISAIFACEINIVPDKISYAVSDYAIFTVTIKQDHARCLHDGEEPKLVQTGLEITGKTQFTKLDNYTWQIKYKAKITDKNASLTVIRECTKGGDKEKIELNVT